jgi:hypothetical protein
LLKIQTASFSAFDPDLPQLEARVRSRAFVTRLSRVVHSKPADIDEMDEVSACTSNEIDTGDQFIDAASQSLKKCLVVLEAKEFV